MSVKQVKLGDGLLTLDPGGAAKELSEQITNAVLEPKVNNGERKKTLSGGTYTEGRSEEWTLGGKMLPDFGETDSIQEYCFTNRGKTFSFEFVPNKDKAKKFSGTLTVEAVQLGGDVGKADEVEFEFPVDADGLALAAYTAPAT